MNIKLTTLLLSSLFGVTPFLARPLLADGFDKKTEFQFSAPVQIPGHTLPAGKYVFQLADRYNDRNVVQVLSEDSSGNESLIATLTTVPQDLDKTPDNPTIHFEERPSGSPEAIQSWYYPGEETGWQFVYPKAEALGAN